MLSVASWTFYTLAWVLFVYSRSVFVLNRFKVLVSRIHSSLLTVYSRTVFVFVPSAGPSSYFSHLQRVSWHFQHLELFECRKSLELIVYLYSTMGIFFVSSIEIHFGSLIFFQ